MPVAEQEIAPSIPVFDKTNAATGHSPILARDAQAKIRRLQARHEPIFRQRA
ncbi:hypothetical protein ACFQXB_15880 [Plastorhodobacter daqingensis]|uniref:Uncharacterized protein n=1 Tax=Plastorhodobacter daqingensis TaxID=1387281 RepID=A0ABW2UNW5_9RHOB